MTAASAAALVPFAAGANHRTCPGALLDRLFVAEADMRSLLLALREAGLRQAIVLSTCDRVEVQGVHSDPALATERALGTLASRARVADGELRAHAQVLHGAAALKQIFAVAAALESRVLGEPQVLGQVKEADRRAREAAMMGPELDTILQAAYGAAKRVRTETAIGMRPVTLAAAAVQLARDVHGDLRRSSGLLLGTGDMGEPMVSHLREAGIERWSVTAPNTARAEEVSRQIGCHVAAYEPLAPALAAADVVVTCAGSGRHLVTPHHLRQAMQLRRQRPVLTIDLGVPPDIDPAADAIDGVFRYDLGDLERLALAGRASREGEAAEAWAILDEELVSFQRQRAERAAVPAIVALRRRFELERARVLREAGNDAARATELLVNRLLHEPAEVLRRLAADGAGGEESLQRVEELLAALFAEPGASAPPAQDGAKHERDRS